MNARVAHLLADYLRRTLGGWALLVLAELLQTSVFWAAQIRRAPLLGAVIASLLYRAALNSPEAVMRTLPLSRRDVGLFRWWVAIGAPGSIILICTLVAAVTNTQHGWWIPSDVGIVMTAGFSLALLGWLAALPLPTMGASGRTRSRFALAWGALTVAAMYGAPLTGLPRGGVIVVTAVGVMMGAWLLVRAARGAWPAADRGGWCTEADRGGWSRGAERGTADARGSVGVGGPASVGGLAGVEGVPDLGVPAVAGGAVTRPPRATLTGWRLLAAEIARSTAYLSVVALLAITIVRACVTPWFLSAFEPALIWLLASAVAVAGSFLTRRWMLTVRSLRLLPIGDYRLAFILYLILVTPGMVTGLVLMGARQLMPAWGLEMPGYMFVLFMLAPAVAVPWQKQHSTASASAGAIQQWSPVLQQAAFPLWAGSLCAFGGPHLQPGWFVAFLALFGAVGSLGGYVALLVGIRSPQGLEA